MSFDLYLYARDTAGVDGAAFQSLFAGRAHYELSERQAIYQNDDTGVYFLFEHIVPESGKVEAEALAEDPRLGAPHIAFSLNYFRPRIFALEAAIELEDLLQGDRFVVHDPQDGLDYDVFAADPFVAHWRYGNNATSRSMRDQGGADRLSQPAAANEAVWRWNYERNALQERFADEEAFVPMVMLFSPRVGEVCRAFVWTASILTIVPPAADTVLLLDDQAPPGLMGRITGKQPGMKVLGLVPVAAIDGLGEAFPFDPAYRRLVPIPRARLAQIARGARDPRERLAIDQVLDAEVAG